jgi:hypothetical protein
MNDMNLHDITNIRIAEVTTLKRDNGETFVVRRITFESEKKGHFQVTAYGNEASELHITFE